MDNWWAPCQEMAEPQLHAHVMETKPTDTIHRNELKVIFFFLNNLQLLKDDSSKKQGT